MTKIKENEKQNQSMIGASMITGIAGRSWDLDMKMSPQNKKNSKKKVRLP